MEKKKPNSPMGSSSFPSSSGFFTCSFTPVSNPADEILLEKFRILWSDREKDSTATDFSCNSNGFPILGTAPKVETGCISYNQDFGNQQINGVQQQRFSYLGSSLSSNQSVADEFQRYIDFKKHCELPAIQGQFMGSLANGGGVLNPCSDLAGTYLNPMANSANRFSRDVFNHQLSIGNTSDDISTATGGSSIVDARNLRKKLIDSKGWPVERAIKILSNDPSLVDEIYPDDIVMVAELKLGSLYLQRVLKDQNPLHFNKIFDATLNNMFRLMTNSEGTYVIRKIHSLCGLRHMNQIVKKIMSVPVHLKCAARNEYGADTIAKLIRVLNSKYPLYIKCVLDYLISECETIMRSKPASSLFKACLKYLSWEQNQILRHIVAANCIDLATDDFGYLSVILLIENTQNLSEDDELLCKISCSANFISRDPKGNFVIQAIFSLHIPVFDFMICRILGGDYVNLSMQKCASNVVEKCIMSRGMCYPVLELIQSRKLHIIAQDPWGNYVVQTALNVTQQMNYLDLYDRLVGEIRPHLHLLQNHPKGVNVYKIIDKVKVIMS